jgi:hypothetical protein
MTMTEAEWLACDKPRDLYGFFRVYGFFRDQAGERKQRLLVAACCRRLWPWLTDPGSRVAVEVVEQLADGRAGREDLIRAREAAWQAYEGVRDDELRGRAAWAVTRALEAWDGSHASGHVLLEVVHVAGEAAYRRAFPAPPKYDRDHPASIAGERAEQAALAGLIRCLIGPLPFRPATVDPRWLSWNGGAVVKLAQSAYDQRSLPYGELDPARLAVLADALEDAGCDNQEMLTHLRGPGPHVRGCWAVDLLLGKS